MIAPLAGQIQGRGPRENFSQLINRAFYLHGEAQPLPQAAPDDVMASFNARRILKDNILQAYQQQQQAQQVQAAQQQPNP